MAIENLVAESKCLGYTISLSRILTTAILLLMLLGCDSKELSVSQWHLINREMTKAEILSVIGDPDGECAPAVSEGITNGSSEPTLTEVAAFGVGSAMFGTPQEYWEYYPPRKADQHREQSQEDAIKAAIGSLFGPADESYVVYFNSDGTVAKLRRPLAESVTD